MGSRAPRSESASSEISMPVISEPPRYSPSRGDDVEGGGGAEVHAHGEAAEALAQRHRVDEPVGADLARVVVADRHAGLRPGPDGEHLVAEVALGHRRPLGLELRHGRGDDRGVEVARSRSRAARAGCAAPRRAGRRSTGARSRSASARAARSPSKAPKWVWVFPTSTTSSIARALCSAPTMARASPSSTSCPARTRAPRSKRRCALKGDRLRARRSAADVPVLIGPLRYGGTTVPGMRIDGERLVGSRTIMRRLDELAPEPPLLPPPGDPRYATRARGRALGR